MSEVGQEVRNAQNRCDKEEEKVREHDEPTLRYIDDHSRQRMTVCVSSKKRSETISVDDEMSPKNLNRKF